MTIRIHPHYCNKGIGQKTLNYLCKLLFTFGFESILLDVHEENTIAKRCYEKCEFKDVDTFKRVNGMYYTMERGIG